MTMFDPARWLADADESGVCFVDEIDIESLVQAAEELGLAVARIDLAGCTDRDEPLRRLAAALRFPAWFGDNWDALADSLGDLSWLPAPGYVTVIDRIDDWQRARPDQVDTLLDIFDTIAQRRAEDAVVFWLLLPLPGDRLATLPDAGNDERRWHRPVMGASTAIPDRSSPLFRTRPVPAVMSLLLALPLVTIDLHARTVYRCVRDGTVSLATAPEPGSRCEANELDDEDPNTPNLWGTMGEFSGQLYRYEREQGPYYSTRLMPGATPVARFSASTPTSTAHAGMGQVGRPRLDRFDAEFKAAARTHAIDDAWLRAIAHAESYFDPGAVSDKGAMGVMQLMPDVVADYGVTDPFDAAESIHTGAHHLKHLIGLYDGDLTLVAAAYNAGVATVTRFEGVPPYPETQEYVGKVHALHARYREALDLPPLDAHLRPAIAGEDDGGWAKPPPGGP